MNSGPSATLGIMFSVTNSGSNKRLTSGDQQNTTASVTPTKAPSAKPPRISTAVTARLDSHAYFADASVATVASGEGNMNFGTWKVSTRTCHNTITARCTIRMTAKVLAERIPSPGTAGSPLPLRGTVDNLVVPCCIGKRADASRQACRASQTSWGNSMRNLKVAGLALALLLP